MTFKLGGQFHQGPKHTCISMTASKKCIFVLIKNHRFKIKLRYLLSRNLFELLNSFSSQFLQVSSHVFIRYMRYIKFVQLRK